MTRSSPSRAGLWFGVALFTLAGVVGLIVRPPLARDETRYLSVAWEMWLRNDWLVPHINGATYSHKPPVLFWLINTGWKVMGVSEWWARAVGPLCAVACLGLAWRLAKLLWPAGADGSRPARPWMAPVILATSVGWMLFASLTMFDAPLTLCVLAAFIGIVKAHRADPLHGWAIVALALGVGILTKGPVVFLHVLPAAVLAPWWGGSARTGGAHAGAAHATNQARPAWGWWYAGVLAALAMGVAIALAWALPAAKAGGEKFANEILWGQSAGRVVSSFRHARPWWFFIPVAPALLFPWIAWPPVWRAVARLGHAWHDSGVRLMLAWIVPALIVFSLISGKQAHYLLPLLAGAAVLLSRLLPMESPEREEPGDHRPLAVTFLVCGLGLLFFPIVMRALPALAAKIEAQPWVFEHHPVGVAVLLGVGVLLLLWDARTMARRIPLVAATFTLVFCVGQWDAMRIARPSLDLSPVGAVLRPFEADGKPIAHLGEYHGQYHFLGRLERPFDLMGTSHVAPWCRQNPSGLVVVPFDFWPQPGAGTPLIASPSGSHTITVWTADQVLSGLAVLNRRGAVPSSLLPTGEKPDGAPGLSPTHEEPPPTVGTDDE